MRAAVTDGLVTVALQVVAEQPQAQWRRELLQPGQSPVRTQVAPPASGAQAVEQLLTWAAGSTAAPHRVLLLMGHGAGLLRQETLPPGAVGAQALAQALPSVTNGPEEALEFVALDTCYGATLEGLYPLRDACRYVTASPGLIHSPGLNWAQALRRAGALDSAATLARAVVEAGMPVAEEPQSLVAVDMSRLTATGEATGKLAALLRADLPRQMPALTFARSHVNSWGSKDELVDLAALCGVLADNAPSDEVRAAAGALRTELGRLIVRRWECGEDAAGGIGVFFPPTLQAAPEQYRHGYDFASTFGWSGLLESYWARVTELLLPVAP